MLHLGGWFIWTVGYIAHLRQQCHNSKLVIFSWETFKYIELLYFYISATTTQLLSSGEFYKLRYETIPVKKEHLQTFLSIPITKKCQILNCDILVANERRDIKNAPVSGLWWRCLYGDAIIKLPWRTQKLY